MQVLITRPKHQAASLVRLVDALGAKSIVLAAMHIVDDHQHASHQNFLNSIDQFEHIIFVSANAVTCSVARWSAEKISTCPSCLAVGPATAAALQSFGMTTMQVANPPSSEGLLQLVCLQQKNINGKAVAIVSGHDPKSLLKNVLQERGAKVVSVYCYQRQCAEPISAEQWQAHYQPDEQLVTVCTSLAVLENLMQISPANMQNTLKCSPLIVVSEAMQRFAKAQGFMHIYQSQDATLLSIESVLRMLCANQA